jgi:hypothetical protein
MDSLLTLSKKLSKSTVVYNFKTTKKIKTEKLSKLKLEGSRTSTHLVFNHECVNRNLNFFNSLNYQSSKNLHINKLPYYRGFPLAASLPPHKKTKLKSLQNQTSTACKMIRLSLDLLILATKKAI